MKYRVLQILTIIVFCLFPGKSISFEMILRIGKRHLRSTKLYDSTPRKYFQGYKQAESKRDAYSKVADFNIAMPCVILVNPFLDENVGSVARTMLNFGLSELRVVDPRCDIRSERAKALAAGASDLLDEAIIYPTLEECIADINRVMATTIRPRDMSQLIYTPSAAAKLVLPSIEKSFEVKTGILFGRERTGLTTEEIAVADSIITIPTYPKFSSLNLAQAVNIIGYEMWSQAIELQGKAPPGEWLQPRYQRSSLATRAELDNLLSRLEKALTERNYAASPRQEEIAFLNIRNIFQRVSEGTN